MFGKSECQRATQQVLFIKSSGEPSDKKQAALKVEQEEADEREAMRSLKVIKGHMRIFLLQNN